MIVELTPNACVASLTAGQKYTVLGIEADSYRILNDQSEPCLYDPTVFLVIDSSEPDFWVSNSGDDGERYAYPPEWNHAGYFEDWHDNVPGVRDSFRLTLNTRFK